MKCYYTETGNVNAIGSAVGVSGPFMLLLLLGNNMSQPLPDRLKRTARSFLPFPLFGQNNVTKPSQRGKSRRADSSLKPKEQERVCGVGGWGASKRHLLSSLMADRFDSCLVQFLQLPCEWLGKQVDRKGTQEEMSNR